VRLFVQLTDRGYEGNYYTLGYDPDTDRLAGVYHHWPWVRNSRSSSSGWNSNGCRTTDRTARTRFNSGMGPETETGNRRTALGNNCEETT